MRGVRTGATAAVCALAAAAAVTFPAALDGGGRQGGTTGDGTRNDRGQPGVTRAAAAADTCEDSDASLRPGGSDGDAVKAIRKRGYLIAGVDQNSYRWGYRDPATDNLSGFDIDLVRAIAKDILGDADKVSYRTIPTSQRVPALQRRTVDVVVRTMTINCERVKQVAFSTAYFTAGQQVLAPKQSPITGYDRTLDGRTVCTAEGSTGATELADADHGAKAKGIREVVLVPNQLDCLVKLQLGQVDAVITDNALAAGQAAQDPTVHLVGDPFTDEPYGVAMNLDSEDLVRRVNRVLEDYRKGGARSPWRKSYDKWLSGVLTTDGTPKPPKAKYRN